MKYTSLSVKVIESTIFILETLLSAPFVLAAWIKEKCSKKKIKPAGKTRRPLE